MKAEDIREARKEYEAEVYRQQHPYEQWISENEQQEKKTDFCGSLELDMDEFCALAGGGEREQRYFCGQLKGKEYVLVVSPMGAVDRRAYPLLKQAFLEHPETDILYADEDVSDRKGKRSDPWFKPAWSPHTFQSFFYFGNIVAFRAAFLEQCIREGCFFRNGLPRIGEEAFFGRTQRLLADSTSPAECFWQWCAYLIGVSGQKPFHIPEILLHMEIEQAGEDIFRTVYQNEKAYHPLYPVRVGERDAKVSAIIPSKDHPELLKQCLKGLREDTDYPDLEIIVVDNGSSEENKKAIEHLQETYAFQYLYRPEEFNFSRMCGQGAAAAAGDVLLFLNDDIEVLPAKRGWLRILAGAALQPETGAVGAKLWYPAEEGADQDAPHRIQHCGITNIALGPVHKLGGLPDSGNLYHCRNSADADVLAVTGACLAVAREKYEAVGGFDEELAVAYNDVDLCFSLYEKEWFNVLRSDAVLIHHESVSRGSDVSLEKRRRQEAEMERLYGKHPGLYGTDPFYSPHLVQERLDVEYHLGYAYPYEQESVRSRIEPLTGPVKTGKRGRFWRKLGVDLQIVGHVDEVRRRVRFAADGKHRVEYQIEGWAAPAEKRAYLYTRSLLLVRGYGSGYELSLYDKLREDAAAVLPQQEAGLLAGYVARIPQEGIEEGEYHLLMAFTRKAGGKKYIADLGCTVVWKDGGISLRREE